MTDGFIPLPRPTLTRCLVSHTRWLHQWPLRSGCHHTQTDSSVPRFRFYLWWKLGFVVSPPGDRNSNNLPSFFFFFLSSYPPASCSYLEVRALPLDVNTKESCTLLQRQPCYSSPPVHVYVHTRAPVDSSLFLAAIPGPRWQAPLRLLILLFRRLPGPMEWQGLRPTPRVAKCRPALDRTTFGHISAHPAVTCIPTFCPPAFTIHIGETGNETLVIFPVG